MPPKGMPMVRQTKTKITKEGGKLLLATQAAESLKKEKDRLRTQLKDLSARKKQKERQAQKLKQKANKIALSELLEVLMMKAYIEDQKAKHNEEPSARSSASSCSAAEWKPTSPIEALNRLQMLAGQRASEVLSFVQSCTEPPAALEPEIPKEDEE